MATAYPHRAHRLLGAMAVAMLLLGWVPPAAVALAPLPAATAGARPANPLPRATMPLWAWPLDPVPRVVRPFDKPPGPYAAGHRGLDLAGRAGQPVLAVAGGTVTHASILAGRGTVTIEHAGAIRSTYEPLTIAPDVRAGVPLARGQPVGTLSVAGGHCPPQACLHLGALRRGTTGEWDYVQPLFLLVATEVVLLPEP